VPAAVTAPRLLRRAGAIGDACPGCGARLVAHAGPTHAYLGASAACLDLYERVRRAPEPGGGGARLRRLIQDAYAVQHPGGHDRRCVQSVAVHLMRLCDALEGHAAATAPAGPRTRTLHWLEPPVPNGRHTLADLPYVGDQVRFAAAVEAWAADVWGAWAPHHATVRGWLAAAAPARSTSGS
jgi:hypothetical protein